MRPTLYRIFILRGIFQLGVLKVKKNLEWKMNEIFEKHAEVAVNSFYLISMNFSVPTAQKMKFSFKNFLSKCDQIKHHKTIMFINSWP